MQGKTVVITGGTSGIGAVAVEELARRGARIVLVARDSARADAMLAKLRRIGPEAAHTVHIADLSLMAEVKRVGAEIAAAEPQIHVLVNNAGAMFSKRLVTPEGLEMTFALNHMAYFVLTKALVTRLVATPGARIISTSSDAHRVGRLDFDDLQSEKNYRGFRVYGTTKLCNILFTRHLRQLMHGTGVRVFCFHPGFVDTQFADNNRGMFGIGIRLLKKIAAISPEKGARTLIHLASAWKLEHRIYWYKCRPATCRDAARDEAAAKRLWEISERLANG